MESGFLERAAGFMWGPPTMGLVLGIGLYLTIKTKGFQFRRFGTVFRETLGSLGGSKYTRKKGDVTPFMAMSTALGATMGTGNIVGVATALTAGGPGAIVWMWLAAAVGMMTKYAEVALAVRFKKTGPGPMGYLKTIPVAGGAMAFLFAVICLLASLGTGNMTQSNSISEALAGAFSVPPALTAIVTGLLCLVVTAMGIRGVVSVSSLIVPFISVAYVVAAVAAIYVNRQYLPGALSEMFLQAFGMRAAAGGAVGYTVKTAMRFGVARGIFSNEAGLGSAPIAHAEADAKDPVSQGMWGVFEVFADTIVSCTLTALVILTAGGGTLWRTGPTGAKLASLCFSEALGPGFGSWIAVFVALFGATSIFGWSAYGQKAIEQLLPGRLQGKAIILYRVLFSVGAALGALWNAQAVWLLSDLMAGAMLLVNLTGLLVLAPIAADMLRAYEGKLRVLARRKKKTGRKQRERGGVLQRGR